MSVREPLVAGQAVPLGGAPSFKFDGLGSIDKLDIWNEGPDAVSLQFFAEQRGEYEPEVPITLRAKRFYSFPSLRSAFGDPGVSGFKLGVALGGINAAVDYVAWKNNEGNTPLPVTVGA